MLKLNVMANEKNKGTNPDVKPTRGQESNENWDRKEENSSSDTKSIKDNSGAHDEDFEKLPNKNDLDRGNLTGPGLG
jgi:hypothetical protein